MGNKKRPRPIRLTNRTAIGLRKSAQRLRSAWLVGMGIVTMIFTVLAVYLGFSWLPAVPLTLMLGGLVIVLMMIISRSQYLLLISQAICTEAASRQMEESRSEKKRREKAIEQLAAMRADVREAQRNGVSRGAFRGDESLLFDLLTGREESDEEVFTRRTSEEDEEMYAASYEGDQEAAKDAEDDLYPPKKNKHSAEPTYTVTASTGSTKPVMKNVKANVQAQATETDAQESGGHRRRRRNAPTGTAPLQLIRNNQAQ